MVDFYWKSKVITNYCPFSSNLSKIKDIFWIEEIDFYSDARELADYCPFGFNFSGLALKLNFSFSKVK